MGDGRVMEQSQRRELDISDLPKLLEMTLELKTKVLSLFNYQVIEENQSPYRYKIFYNEQEFEFIFSSLGSFTVRPLSKIFQKKAPPIFYLSIKKNSSSLFQWEEIDSKPFQLEEIYLKKILVEAFENFQKSKQNELKD